MSGLSGSERLRLRLKQLEHLRALRKANAFYVRRFLPNPFEQVLSPAGMANREFIFIHVPKTAGTSITKAFEKKALHIPLARYYAVDPERADATLKVAVCRDPAERLHSAFNYHHSSIGVNASADVRWAEETLGQYAGFKEFLEDLQDAKRRRKFMMWPHYRPQIDWLVSEPGGPVSIDLLGRFEELPDFLSTLSHNVGQPISIGHDRKPRMERKSLQLDAGQKALIADMYGADYEYFGYRAY
ncbi:Sulfotransferase family protein [Roseivivax halotolerans]|uniref:Sulfotransferase family protein n=1 Tax=Roseivivax halotolerans TaxID=93684 RepID=A0A1I6A2I8_9RHOB|nr:sulfotransferase family 2 domain-containing protein [Roseivivax halotolerans]SFQ62840.1 Sulfotransferase family protein [Roseivivax halotolerans]